MFIGSILAVGVFVLAQDTDALRFEFDGMVFRLFPVRGGDSTLNQYVSFKLFTSDPDNYEVIKIGDENSVRSSSFDFRSPTVVFLHGFLEPGERSNSARYIKNAYVKRGGSNVIVVDWSELAAGPWYTNGVRNTKEVGKHTARLIDYLVSIGAPLSSFHVIGHSLGGQVAGSVGDYITSGKIPRITGLDPALPGFRNPSSNTETLDASDAEFVDVIHTDAGIFGIGRRAGHVDFYPNAGRAPQPGCRVSDIILRQHGISARVFCSHWRSYMYYARTVTEEKRYLATPCSDWQKYKSGLCLHNRNSLPMGINVPPTASGEFYLDITENPE